MKSQISLQEIFSLIMFYATYSCFFIIACKSLDLNLVLTLVFSPFNANKKQKSNEMVRLRTSTPLYPQTFEASAREIFSGPLIRKSRPTLHFLCWLSPYLLPLKGMKKKRLIKLGVGWGGTLT